MRRMVVELMAWAVLLTGAPASWGQAAPGGTPPKKETPAWPATTKSKLEEMLEQALKDNPDLSVAAAKVATAQAELTRTRLQVTQKVVALYYALEGQKAQVATLQARLKRLQQLHKDKAVSDAAVAEAEELLRTAKAKLAELEAEQPYLLGLTRRREALAHYRTALDAQIAAAYRYRGAVQGLAGEKARADEGRLLALRGRVKGAVAEKIRAALDRPVSVRFEKTPLEVVLDLLKAKAPGVTFHTKRISPTTEKVTGEHKDVPLGAVLEWLEDVLDARFVVREYGLLLAPSNMLPPGSVPLHDFWKGGDKEPLALPAKNPPKKRVEGLIEGVDASGLVTLSIGSDAGLAKGNTLDVYRRKLAPLYLGTIRIVELTPHKAVGQPIGRMTAPPQRGDHVTADLAGK